MSCPSSVSLASLAFFICRCMAGVSLGTVLIGKAERDPEMFRPRVRGPGGPSEGPSEGWSSESPRYREGSGRGGSWHPVERDPGDPRRDPGVRLRNCNWSILVPEKLGFALSLGTTKYLVSRMLSTLTR